MKIVRLYLYVQPLINKRECYFVDIIIYLNRASRADLRPRFILRVTRHERYAPISFHVRYIIVRRHAAPEETG